MYKNEGLKRLNNSVTYDRGVRLKYSSYIIFNFSFVICHLSFLICHKSYELARKHSFYWFVKLIYKRNYYWFNSQEILQKAKEKYSNEKAAGYYKQHKETIKEKSKKRYKNLSHKEKGKIKEYQRKRISRIGPV